MFGLYRTVMAGSTYEIHVLRSGGDYLSPRAGRGSNAVVSGIRLGKRPNVFYCGGSDPRYELIAMMSSSERLATTGFISSAAFPALEPCLRSKSWRAM
jgi:hypothetical protein